MKIGIQTNSLSENSYGRWGDNAYKKLKEHGYDCSDFNMADTNSSLYTLPQNEAEAVLLHEKQLAEEAGIEITQVHGPWRWPVNDSTEEDRAERMEKMKKSIRFASILGCRNWVVHPIMPYGINEINTDDAQKTWDLNVTFMKELLKTAKEYDITICLENMPMINFSIAKPEDILRFVKEIDDDNFKICLDTGHVNVFNELNLAEETKRLGDYIKVLHVHDNKYGIDMHLLPFFGTADWIGFSEALKEIGFKGSFSLEALPPYRLDESVYEDMCKMYFKVAQSIIK